ncbi:hypothetical protein W911_11880 [Hyphomicrobium nitrativorans NL23]|uniref:Alpha/beta hydrolase n=1 Tax=Hyphomicrobium nitrativorans NL23 TaxID=1029756 RepID=V5SDK0_9HYPH|nr:hypothetical protein [Hyphomicrobium nitrativorans]AHB48946.1 hypothetical protein W911_11880 [Hyphomicrobium nitrativorans NL23]
MATVVTVHGTYAHSGGTAEALQIGGEGTAEWWQQNGALARDLKTYVTGSADGRLDFVPFTWSANNSELDRRRGGSELLKLLRSLDEKEEPYAVVGHSHGGSVISAALIESVARGKPLTHLKRWVTVGTPFVGMRKERFLFSRVSLTGQVIFVASLMLFMMFLFFVAGELLSGGFDVGPEGYSGLLFSGTMMSLPILFYYVVFRYLDHRKLIGYSRGTAGKARAAYADKWLPLVHKDDEAVHGLRYLPKAELHFFEDDFAAGTLTKASIVALPLIYLMIVMSPKIMLGLSDFLQDKVYGVQRFVGPSVGVEQNNANQARDELRRFNRRIREADEQAERGGLEPAKAEDARRRGMELRREMRAKRRQIEIKFPEFVNAERAQRFKERFLERDGRVCFGGRLCGSGRDYILNSKLLFHVVTDELTAAVVNEDMLGGTHGNILRLATPIVLVPVAFALLALGVLALIQYAASHLSVYVSRALNRMTRAEVKRSSFGNDTDGEVVVGADYGPSWLDPVTCILPEAVSDKISDHSNAMMAQSVSKFRSAISTLAFSESEDRKAGLVASYLSWKELVHTCYFDVDEFRRIVAHAISQSEGFAPTEAFRQDGSYAATESWVAALGRPLDPDMPETGLAVDGAPPTPQTFPA